MSPEDSFKFPEQLQHNILGDGMFNGIFAQQGWQCPICKRVYSPHTAMCYYCGGKETVVSTGTELYKQTPEN